MQPTPRRTSIAPEGGGAGVARAGRRTGAWRDLIPEPERAAYAAAGYGRRAPRGERPALLVVDCTYRFVGLPAPIEESLAVYPSSTGQRAWEAVSRARLLLVQARRHGHPVFFTVRDENEPVQRSQPRRDKHFVARPEPAEANEVVAPLKPRRGEAVLAKSKPSAFHGTPLSSMLVYRGADTLVIVGGVTSGCVRATAVDAFSLGYRVVVPEDAVFDRSELVHAVHLFDLEQKYAEVPTASEVASYLAEPGRGRSSPARRRQA